MLWVWASAAACCLVMEDVFCIVMGVVGYGGGC